jgi:RHS repeat-associated protein
VKGIGGATTTYGYDGFGQRVRKTVNGVTTRYLVHDGQVAMDLNASGGIVAEYTYYAGTDRPHGMRRGGVQYFYVQDAQGNVIGLLNASGAVVEGYEYTPQGVLVGGGGGVANPYRYKGREWDAEAGLYYMRARYYDPVTSRFVSEDPIGLEGGINPYVFVSGDPVNYSDPSGLTECPGGWFWFTEQIDEDTTRITLRCSGFVLTPIIVTPSTPRWANVTWSANFGVEGRRGGNLAAGIVPGVATIHDGATLITGRNWITEERVGLGGRVLAGVGVLTPVSAPELKAAYGTVRRAIRGTGLQAHHLIEQRFRHLFAEKPYSWTAIALTKEQHQLFTNAWRNHIGYGEGTDNATFSMVEDAARRVYADHPDLLRVLGLKQ